jgi:hypothetical protein
MTRMFSKSPLPAYSIGTFHGPDAEKLAGCDIPKLEGRVQVSRVYNVMMFLVNCACRVGRIFIFFPSRHLWHVMSRDGSGTLGPSRVGVGFISIDRVGQIWRHSGRYPWKVFDCNQDSRDPYSLSKCSLRRHLRGLLADWFDWSPIWSDRPSGMNRTRPMILARACVESLGKWLYQYFNKLLGTVMPHPDRALWCKPANSHAHHTIPSMKIGTHFLCNETANTFLRGWQRQRQLGRSTGVFVTLSSSVERVWFIFPFNLIYWA